LKGVTIWTQEQDAALAAIAKSGRRVTWPELVAAFKGVSVNTLRRHALKARLKLNIVRPGIKQPLTGGIDHDALSRILGGTKAVDL
jgi:hypothetical protein